MLQYNRSRTKLTARWKREETKTKTGRQEETLIQWRFAAVKNDNNVTEQRKTIVFHHF